MASRCINALNELDAISDKIFYKYSKNRLKQEIANKVRDSKSRAERNASPVGSRQEKCTPRKSNCSNRSSNISTAATTKNSSTTRAKSCGAKSTDGKTSMKVNQDPRKSKSLSYKKPIRTSSEATTAETVNNSEDTRNFTPSIYGKFTPGAPAHKTGKWFNLKEGVDQGVIDSFECDKLRERALCYKVDAKESKAVPKLLRHRLEVRIGRNGSVRNEDAGMKPDDQGNEVTRDGSKRTAPLSWEEQLNWKNTQIIEPKASQPTNSKDEGLCETHPVIFHPEANHKQLSNTTNMSNKASASYRLYMDKKLVSDRRNLTCGLKCVTSVQIEDGSGDVVCKDDSNPMKRTKSHDSDMMDMSNTIKNIEKIYRTSSEESERKVPQEKTSEEDNQSTKNWVENPDHHKEKDKNLEEEKVKISKKVSFKDDLEGQEVLVINSARKDILNLETKVATTNENTKRPSSSLSRSNLDRYQEFKTNKAKRPYTAPHCSPRTPKDLDFLEKIDKSSHVKQLMPILVPTSNDNEVLSESEVGPQKEMPEPSEKVHDIRVTFGCKSAPTARTVKHAEEPIQRSLSTTSTRVKTEKYVRPEPTAVLDNSDPMELPPYVPPGQALIELRKKIRENLAKETADLQLDIQQLYIKHHSYRN